MLFNKFLIAFCLGFLLAHALGDAKVSRLEAEYAQKERDTAQAAEERLAVAQQRGDTLTLDLQNTQLKLKQTEKERSHALTQLTTGRACLGADAVRVLNRASDRAVTLPQASGSDIAADGTFASDTDIAQWISGAQTQYDECRQRLNVLIHWFAE